jgi:hypothetical protein
MLLTAASLIGSLANKSKSELDAVFTNGSRYVDPIDRLVLNLLLNL